MLSTIFFIISVIIVVWLAWYIFCQVLGFSLAVIGLIIASPIFWGAVGGGLVAYWLGYHSDQGIITGIVIGAIVMGLFWACTHYEIYKPLRFLGWIALGLVLGHFLGMTIFLGLVGFCVAVYRVC